MSTLGRRISTTLENFKSRHKPNSSISSNSGFTCYQQNQHEEWTPNMDQKSESGGSYKSDCGSCNRPASAAANNVSWMNSNNKNNGLEACSSSRSISMNSISSSEGSSESHVVGQEDIVALTHDVRSIKEALGKLRRIFHPDRDKQDCLRVSAHERLGEVLRVLRSILEKYPPIQSTELLMAAGQLIQQVKGYNYEFDRSDPTEFFESIDQLALAFSSRVSEYLMGDIDTSSTVHPAARTRSCENLLPGDAEALEASKVGREQPPDGLSPQEIDELLTRLEHGVNIALHRAKVWAKYAKDVMTYIEKRAALESEYARSLLKLAQTMRPVLKEESFLPFQSIYCTAIDQDVENCNISLATCSLLQGHKFIEPLTSRKNEHERVRKQIKEMWQRELKKMQDAVNNVRKAKALYDQRLQEYDKAKESAIKAECSENAEAASSKVDRKRRMEDDAMHKAMEAETSYKTCVVEANERRHNLEKVKAIVLQQVRELMLQCDQTMKAVTVAYFQLQHTVAAPAPVQFQTLCESSRLYEPGSQYMEFVKRLSASANPSGEGDAAQYMFEPFTGDVRLLDKERKSNGSIDVGSDDLTSSPHPLSARLSCENILKDKPRGSTSSGQHPLKAWSQSVVAVLGSDTDSTGSSRSNKSLDTSPSASPQVTSRRGFHASCGEDLDTEPDGAELNISRRSYLSKAALTHTFRKLKTPSRCRECDSYVYFQGLECGDCGLTCHKKCLETLAIQCGHKRLPRRMTTFGVDLTSHLRATSIDVPCLITRCVHEIDQRGCHVKGIYRVSGVKSKVEKLCQSFENGADLVDLTDVHPNVIANVVKLYLRQLPEPLLTTRLYPEFIRIAKEHPAKGSDPLDRDYILSQLKDLVYQLPRQHRVTLRTLMKHLRRISDLAQDNNMPPSNLGIVFGPTLLRTAEGSASLNSLVDTVHQTRAIELLITFSDEIFSDEECRSSEDSTPIESPDKSPTHSKIEAKHSATRTVSNSSQESRGMQDEGAVGEDIDEYDLSHMPRRCSSSPQDEASPSPSWCEENASPPPPSDDWQIINSDTEDTDSLHPTKKTHSKPTGPKISETPLSPSAHLKVSRTCSQETQKSLSHQNVRKTYSDCGVKDAPTEANSATAKLAKVKSSVATQTDQSFLLNHSSARLRQKGVTEMKREGKAQNEEKEEEPCSKESIAGESNERRESLSVAVGTEEIAGNSASADPTSCVVSTPSVDRCERIIIHVAGPPQRANESRYTMDGNHSGRLLSVVNVATGGQGRRMNRRARDVHGSDDDLEPRCMESSEDDLASHGDDASGEELTEFEHFRHGFPRLGRHVHVATSSSSPVSPHSLLDQDSGFEDIRPSPGTSPNGSRHSVLSVASGGSLSPLLHSEPPRIRRFQSNSTVSATIVSINHGIPTTKPSEPNPASSSSSLLEGFTGVLYADEGSTSSSDDEPDPYLENFRRNYLSREHWVVSRKREKKTRNDEQEEEFRCVVKTSKKRTDNTQFV